MIFIPFPFIPTMLSGNSVSGHSSCITSFHHHPLYNSGIIWPNNSYFYLINQYLFLHSHHRVNYSSGLSDPTRARCCSGTARTSRACARARLRAVGDTPIRRARQDPRAGSTPALGAKSQSQADTIHKFNKCNHHLKHLASSGNSSLVGKEENSRGPFFFTILSNSPSPFVKRE